MTLRIAALLLLPVLTAPSTQRARPSDPERLASVLIEGVPHIKQRPDFCGEACAEMWLKKLGKDATQDDVFALTGLDPSLGRGAWTDDMAKALKKMGFDVGQTWYRVSDEEGVAEQFRALHADLLRGVPSITCGHYSDEPQTTEHFRLILGYDAVKDEVVYHEPAEEKGSYRRMKRELFLKLWTFKPRPDRWTLIRMRLDPKNGVSAERDLSKPSAAEFVQRVMELKEKTRGKPFTIVVERPFVLIGDEPPKTVREHGVNTVRWTVSLLRKDYFAKDPEEIIDVWAFKDATSYKRYAWEYFGDRPDTPYGYYSDRHHALIMNIGLGYGTLVHEIVHPYMHVNFPEVPPWLNEGLASLYERPAEADGHIIGYVNWRLPALQQAIRAKAVPSFKTVFEMDENKFYNDDDDHYAQSRYLCLYLQEKGLLRTFVAEFLKNKKDDPSGYGTLQKVLGTTDMVGFQKKWERYVAELKPKSARAPKPD
ncbi:MAG: C39 family peptidase [Myxococcales bacterium]